MYLVGILSGPLDCLCPVFGSMLIITLGLVLCTSLLARIRKVGV